MSAESRTVPDDVPPPPPRGPVREVPPSITIEVVEDPDGLEELFTGWDALVARSPDASTYLTRAWVESWWNHFGRPRVLAPAVSCRPHVVVARRGGEITAIVPWLASRVGGRHGFRLLVGIGQETADYGGMILGPDAAGVLPALLDHVEFELGRGRTVIDFTRLLDGGLLSVALRDRFADHPRYSLTRDVEEPYPCLTLPGDETATKVVERLIRANDVRRRMRRLSEQHEVDFTYHRPGRAREDFATFLRLHSERWATKRGVLAGVFAEPAGQRFLGDAVEALDEAGILRLSFVTADGAPIAARFGTEFGDRYQGMKSGWDPAFASFGPGHIAVAQILRHLAANHLREFDFLRGAALHKLIWANGERHVSYQVLGRADRWSDLDQRLLWGMLRLRNRVRR